MKERCVKLLRWISIILILGLCYAFIIESTGFSVPCIFKKFTGFKCPGCGLTLICMCILNYIFHGFNIEFLRIAFKANPFLFCISPFVSYFVLKYLIVWLKTGEGFKETVFDKILICILLLVSLFWTIYRNIYI